MTSRSGIDGDTESEDQGRWSSHRGRIGILIGASILSGCWATTSLLDALPSDHGHERSSGLIALAMLLVSGTILPVLGLRLFRSHGRPGKVLMAWLSIAVASLSSARTAVVDVDRAVVDTASNPMIMSAPILDVVGVIRRIEQDESARGVDGDIRWNPIRAVIDVTGGDVKAWIGSRLAVRFDRPGGQEIEGTRVVLRGRWARRSAGGGLAGIHRSPMPGWVPGLLIVPHPGLIDVLGSSPVDVQAVVAPLRSAWKTAIGRMDERIGKNRDASDSGILTAMLTGDRSGLSERFTNASIRSGTSHLLAISGLHLAVIAVIAGGIVRIPGLRPSRLQDSIVMGAILVFGIAVVPSPSVQRSILMVVACGGLRIMGRRVRTFPVVLLCLSTMCFWDPGLMRSVGFQLTSVATIALSFAMSTARRRWFGPADRTGCRRRSLVRDRVANAVTAGNVAWTSTIPIIMGSFGVVSLLSVPATIVVMPLIFPILGLGAIFGVVEMFLPGLLTDFMASTLAVPIDLFAFSTVGIGKILPVFSVTRTSMAVFLSIPMSVGIALLSGCTLTWFRWGGFAVVILAMVSVVGFRNTRVPPAVCMIDVGDGSAILVRDGRRALLYDAGSTSTHRFGLRRIIPTLRRIGVRGLDAIVISHANADHFNAIPDILQSMPVGRILTTHDVLERARGGVRRDLLEMIESAHAAGVPVLPLERGDEFTMDRLRFRVIHPRAGDDHRTVNDSSMVIGVEVLGPGSGGGVDLLLCGDIETEGMARVLKREPATTVTVMELPHHGSWRPIGAEMIRVFDPAVVIQSTGGRRWRHDRYGPACEGRRRRVTARDGSFVVQLVDE